MMDPIRIGTRRSMLAMAQAKLVAQAIQQVSGRDTLLVPIVTSGDRHAGPLAPLGGKGLFTAELEQALRSGQVELAVHSAKDMPARLDDDVVIAAVPAREDPRDALASLGGKGLLDLPPGAAVGTGSPRRRAQLLAVRPDLRVMPLRGNVETRLNRALSGDMDAVVLAMAGLNRSGLAKEHVKHVRPLDLEQFIPAAAQGALAVQSRADDAEMLRLAKAMDHEQSRQATMAERYVLRELAADCHSCLALHVGLDGGRWRGLGMAARPDGSDPVRALVLADRAESAGEALLEALRQAGAESRLGH